MQMQMQIQVQRGHGITCNSRINAIAADGKMPSQRHHFHCHVQLSFSSVSPLRLRLQAASHSHSESSFGFGRFNLFQLVERSKGPKVAGPMPPARATSDRSLNLNANANANLQKRKMSRNGIGENLALGLMFASWNLFNIYFNIFNKQVLKVYPFPMTVTALQFGIGSLLILLMWALNLHHRPKISSLSQLGVIGVLAAVHTMGNAFTNMSLLKVAVSFTHTVKAMEPFFSVLLSALFLHQQPSGLVIATLIPVVGGVALASFTEASFNWIGFWSAMASNLANQSRNVVSKKLMTNNEESLDNINLFSLITIISFFLSVPLMIFTEGITITPAYLQATGLNIREIYVRCLLAGICFHAYQQAGYMLLERVSPVSHSVGNCVKRVVVIVASVLFFRTPISPVNSLGTGIALAGVFFYSRVNRIKRKSP